MIKQAWKFRSPALETVRESMASRSDKYWHRDDYKFFKVGFDPGSGKPYDPYFISNVFDDIDDENIYDDYLLILAPSEPLAESVLAAWIAKGKPL